MKTYKGFDENLKCRDFQYEIGKEYEEEGPIQACVKGFHGCEMPLDVLRHYPLGQNNRYCEVEQSGDIRRDSNDTKVASSKIKIGAEIGIPGLIKAGVEYVQEKCKDATEETASGERGNAAASGWMGNAAASGWMGNAAASGVSGNAAASGESGNAAASGEMGNAAASGERGNAAASGESGNAAASGESGNAAASGERGNAAASGWMGNAAASGERGAATATGEYGSAEASGEQCLATAWGRESKAKGAIGCWLVLTEHYKIKNGIKNAAMFKVDGKTIKADTWYTLKDGKPVEV